MEEKLSVMEKCNVSIGHQLEYLINIQKQQAEQIDELKDMVNQSQNKV